MTDALVNMLQTARAEHLEVVAAIDAAILVLVDGPVKAKQYAADIQKHQATRAKATSQKHHNGLHWTQKPENAGKLARMVERSRAARRRARKGKA